jgi:Zn-dependent metalloprotease
VEAAPGTPRRRVRVAPGGSGSFFGRYFYRVETRRFAERWIHWVDAADGKVLAKLDAIQDDHGTGVKGDVKYLDGQAGLADDLTVLADGIWHLISRARRQFTSDARNTGSTSKAPATDADNHWTLVTPDRGSPGQPALVDAHYYGNVTTTTRPAKGSTSPTATPAGWTRSRTTARATTTPSGTAG